MSSNAENGTGLVEIAGNEVSFQVVQDIYNDITGKSETSQVARFENHVVGISDIEQLNHRITQAIEQYDCHAFNMSISVYYADGHSERFSGIERFQQLSVAINIPSTAIDIEYNFLLKLPKTKEAKPYKLYVGLLSSLGTMYELKSRNASPVEKSIALSKLRPTAKFNMEYIDLAVSQAINSMVLEWYRGVRKEKEWHPRLKSFFFEHWAYIVRCLAMASSAALTIFMFKGYVTGLEPLFFCTIVGVVTIQAANLISLPISTLSREWLEELGPHSKLNFSNSDSDLISSQRRKPIVMILKFGFSAATAVAIGIATTFISSLLLP